MGPLKHVTAADDAIHKKCLGLTAEPSKVHSANFFLLNLFYYASFTLPTFVYSSILRLLSQSKPLPSVRGIWNNISAIYRQDDTIPRLFFFLDSHLGTVHLCHMQDTTLGIPCLAQLLMTSSPENYFSTDYLFFFL